MSRNETKSSANAVCVVVGILLAAVYIAICFLAFPLTGSVLLPLAISLFGTAIVTALFVLVNKSSKSAVSIGFAQVLLVAFFIVYAVAKELIINYEAGWVKYWIDFFYFDKFLVLGSVWLSSTAVITFKRLLTKEKDSGFRHFFKLSSLAFVLFYVALLVYSFVLIRLRTGEYPLNLVPFLTIKEYISDWNTIPYEVFMMFFGNLLYFTPMGYIFYVALRNSKCIRRRVIIFIFPLVAFSFLELSQYIFQNGFCEIDDMLMNSIGFWFGAFLAPVSDKITKSITKGRINYFWG